MQTKNERGRLVKAIGTEETVINIIEELCRKFAWTYRSRVIPSISSNEEIDVLLFTEKVILIIEVKRWSGQIKEWSEEILITEDQGGILKERKNPLIQLRKKRAAMEKALMGKWWSYERCAVGGGEEKQIPLRSVVVFGNTTFLSPEIEKSNPLKFNELAMWEDEVKTEIPNIVFSSAAISVQGLPRTSLLKSFGWRCRGVLILRRDTEIHFAFLDHRKSIDLGDAGVALPHQIKEIRVTERNGVRARLFGSNKEFLIRNKELFFHVIGRYGHPEKLSVSLADLSCFTIRASDD